MPKTHVSIVLILGCFLATAGLGQCWECENIGTYPGVQCAPVSISDQGKTECHVVSGPNIQNHCAFSNIETGVTGEDCEWEFDGPIHPPDVPEQGCEISARVQQEAPVDHPRQVVTPNGQPRLDWTLVLPFDAKFEG